MSGSLTTSQSREREIWVESVRPPRCCGTEKLERSTGSRSPTVTTHRGSEDVGSLPLQMPPGSGTIPLPGSGPGGGLSRSTTVVHSMTLEASFAYDASVR